ncbi:MAG: InlB B-repeat-containing protein [Acholeplasmatales bacterium]|jgi:hypothetical protein|nr:InlB B-repeat-containing protein [Acholeplasmatales bacterium]
MSNRWFRTKIFISGLIAIVLVGLIVCFAYLSYGTKSFSLTIVNHYNNVTQKFELRKKQKLYEGFLVKIDGYTFSGFYQDSTYMSIIDETYEIKSSIVVYPRYTANECSVNYINVTNSNNVSSFSVLTSPIYLNNPSMRVGYEFAGWYTTPSYNSDSRVTVLNSETYITSNADTSLVLYAKWVEVIVYGGAH